MVKVIKIKKKIIDSTGTREYGKILLNITYKTTDIDIKIDDDIKKIQYIYFDHFENDLDIIKEKCEKVEEMILKKDEDNKKAEQKMEFLRSAHKSISYELGKLRHEKENLEVIFKNNYNNILERQRKIQTSYK